MKDDPWVAANSPIQPEKLHALGVVNYRWNHADFILKLIAPRYGFAAKERPYNNYFLDAWAEVHDKGDLTLCNGIRKALRTNVIDDQETKDAVLYGLELYEVNRRNRNQLSHFGVGMRRGSDLTRLKGAEFDPQPFPDSLEDIRRVADEIQTLILYLGGLYRHFCVPIITSTQLSDEPPPLPDRPTMPAALWTPPSEAPPRPPKHPADRTPP